MSSIDELGDQPFNILSSEPERINPAIIFAEELMRKSISEPLDFDDVERAEEVLAFSRDEIERVENHFAALVKTPVAPGAQIPIGF